MTRGGEDVMAEQLRYYRLTAQYDHSNRGMLRPVDGAEWSGVYRSGYDSAVRAAETASKGKDVLEFAGGTGLYTAVLAAQARRLTVVDAAPEALQRNRTTVCAGHPDVEFEVADLFHWDPPRRYEVVFFAFWLSHVPHSRFEEFWARVRRALADDGEVVFVDSMAPAYPAGAGLAPPEQELFPEERIDEEVSVRHLPDGRRFRIVRVLWHRSALQARLGALGWTIGYDNSSPWLVARAQPRPLGPVQPATSGLR